MTVEPMTGLRPTVLRDSSDHLWAWNGESVDWMAKAGEIVMLVDRTPANANRVMFSLDADQLASMLAKALRTQEHLSADEDLLRRICEAYLAQCDAREDA